MKKLLFGLTLLFAMGTTAIGQTLTEVAKKNIVNAQMVLVVNTAKTFYVRGQSYDDFIKAMSIPSPTVPSQDEFFRKVHGYLSTSTADCDILKSDNAILGRFAKDLSQSPKNVSTPADAYSGKKKWWQIAINFAFNVALDVIFDQDMPDVDFFPEE